MKRLLLGTISLLVCIGVQAAQPTLQAQSRPDDARVYILSPADGATVPRTFTVRFGLHGMGVAPAGVDRKDTGHHHLLIDVAKLPPAGQPIPADAHHRHFGGGQTETTLTLTPGTHTLQLELADSRHVPFARPLISRRITVHVK
ncbi:MULTISPECIES: DUF4399 domain-containing protein [Oleiagrimonas]|uniref:DUF4399 domain-containing protein n=1 Tax=Oleiagrimonas citrea TaxID=1665687 RepID=A0A846ZMP8_9GAMM|nr:MULTISPECIES: DUF4399 domain-containing protein [Oleiagrimonas]NKZ38850.1 DUF4399 domain-containing protein [Oleiagrimonas citrea]RAP59168.1 rod shape-determining protein RodA [Oleiagrimonas sp. MCCC 1A03011]